MRLQTPSSDQNQPGWPSLDLRDGLDDSEPSRSRCGGDVAPVSVPYFTPAAALWHKPEGERRGLGGLRSRFFLELHLTLSGWFIPGGAEAGYSGVTQEDGDDVAGVGISPAFRVASPPHTGIPSVYSPGLGIRSPLPRPSPTHTRTGNNKLFFGCFFFAAAWCKHAAPFVR